MTRRIWTVLGALMVAALIAPASAQDARETDKAQTQFGDSASSSSSSSGAAASDSGTFGTRVKTLLADGYEIKTVNVVPRNIVTAAGSTLDVDAVVILLQKGPQMASCYVTYEGFVKGWYWNGENPSCTIMP